MEIILRQDRSTVTWLLQTIIRPLKPLLVRSSFKAPDDQLSVQCSPPRRTRTRCHITERQVEGLYVYDIAPKHIPKPRTSTLHNSPGSAARHEEQRQRIYYFAGGGFKMPPSGQHWSLCSMLAHSFPNTIVSIVSYPLAPVHPATVSLAALYKFFNTIMLNAAETNERVILAGDSSGGNIALCLTLYGASPPYRHSKQATDDSAKDTSRQPAAAVLICPTADLSQLPNEGEYAQTAQRDPILTLESHNAMVRKWLGSSPPDDPSLSPLYADLEDLAASATQLFVVSGGLDILAPDELRFRDKCVASGVKGKWLHWEKQMHVWPLTYEYGIPEGRQAKDWIVECISSLSH